MTVPVDIFRGERIQVVGMARSGLAAARALALGGSDVACWDDGEAGRAQAQAEGFALRDPSAPGALNGAAALILAPGVPLTHPKPHPAVPAARAAGVPILGDVELLARQQTAARFIAITGTNGKSTTTALIAHMLSSAGKRVEVGGNLGRAALSLEPIGPDEIYVLETSSYQLDLIEEAAFDIGVFLNLTPDHLDRHGSLQGYLQAKRRIFKNDKPGGAAVVAVDDVHTAQTADEIAARGARRLVRVSAEAPCPGGVYAEGPDRLIDDLDGTAQPVVAFADCPALKGRHNRQNAAAAYAVCRLMGVSAADAAAGLKSFPGLAHRQELVAQIDGIAFVNDSKATNAEAAAKALAAYERIYWIAGGRPKEGGLDAALPHLAHVRHVFLIGEAEEAFEATLKDKVSTTRSGELARAVEQAFTLAGNEGGAGAAILLSPACASFDQFKDFEARGEAFRSAVKRLAHAREEAS
ncbi:MAG: UDP-N-acetylmuramoyl-L-alanine--D-glutamate ligase [Marivibrio sp.]|uniref:UDP-N-acetylmuramoyl-L-alanine--D-glutamate ligase n=1 Tax=Marivibrio sp. TaxID=2039719 RepID=UPI0032EE39F5